jgi:RHS repeat-associated protein
VYDAFGRRVQKIVNGTSTQFLCDLWNPIQELQGGTPSANLLSGLGIDQYFQRTDSSGPSSYLTDALGSTLALASSTGALTTSYTYDPFGSTTVAGASSNPYQFAGRENDGTNLYFYRARYYSPTFQRFFAQDPIGFDAGDPNLYGYVMDDPANYIDPLGTTKVGPPPNRWNPNDPDPYDPNNNPGWGDELDNMSPRHDLPPEWKNTPPISLPPHTPDPLQRRPSPPARPAKLACPIH